MPRKPTSKKQQQSQDMFPPIGQEIPQDTGQGNEPDLAAQVAELKGVVSTLADTVKAGASREEKMQNLILSIAAGGGQRQGNEPPAQVVPTGVDLSKLPDPTKDPEGFKAGLNAQITSAIQTNVSATVTPMRRQQEQHQKLQELWQRFSTKHKDLADYQDLAESIATRMVQAAVRNGMDAEKFVFGVDNGDTFIDTVADGLQERLDAIRGGKQGGPGNDDEDEGGDDDTVTDPQGRAIPRTLGLDGPQANPGQPNRPVNPRDQKPTTLVDELKEAQTRARIY